MSLLKRASVEEFLTLPSDLWVNLKYGCEGKRTKAAETASGSYRTQRKEVDEQRGKAEWRCQQDTPHHIWPSSTLFLLPSSLQTMKAVLKDVTVIWNERFYLTLWELGPSASNILWRDTWDSETLIGEALLSTYSKTAGVQCGDAQREVRSLSVPFIHSLIQLEGNYRRPEAWRFSSVYLPIREPHPEGSSLAALADVCIHVKKQSGR